ncbi:pyruvate kinase [Mycoplasmopsis columbina SF7]|uniref:Pyruvate kinase n=1 Tax=Mycoplasmopsis columbina SF7 TaxID=1037410 RepID=F9UKG8_9BACT|nr:pyruvate kinase [Mycoplasmopsis columbina]EGV00173.1 pyruvate kinase [Mycoplasmopsis columbina SF7]
MNSLYKKSKLIITAGPASDSYENMKKLVLAGATCIRANFSHGTHEEQANKFSTAKAISNDLQVPISLLLDTKGPEIRIGKMKDGGQEILADSLLTIHTNPNLYSTFEGNTSEVAVHYDMSQDLKVGDEVLFDDGKLTSHVVKIEEQKVIVKTLNTHFLKTNKRINLPGVDFSLPFLSQKDIDDVKFGIEQEVNYIAASFVNNAQNIRDLKELLKNNGGEHIKIIAKIESDLGVKNLDEILDEVDGIMVARGDLGLEIPYYEVPYAQKIIIEKCRQKGKLVIVATQMLDSMENNPQPTRAEVSDVYLAIMQQADSTMLSGESATGKYPKQAVTVMSRIAKRAEEEVYANLREFYTNTPVNKLNQAQQFSQLTYLNDVKLMIIQTDNLEILRELSKARPNVPVIGVINNSKMINAFGVESSIWIDFNSLSLYSKFNLENLFIDELKIKYGLKTNEKILVIDKNFQTKIK